MARRADAAVTVSADGHPADWRAEDIVVLDSGVQEFTAVDPAGVHHRLRIRLPGRYNVANALLALAMLDAVGVSPEQASPGLREASVPGRLEAVERGQDFLAVVDYAHKPGRTAGGPGDAAQARRAAGRGVRRRGRPRPGQARTHGAHRR